MKRRGPIPPLPPLFRLYQEGNGFLNNHQKRRDLANKCIELINADRKAEAEASNVVLWPKLYTHF